MQEKTEELYSAKLHKHCSHLRDWDVDSRNNCRGTNCRKQVIKNSDQRSEAWKRKELKKSWKTLAEMRAVQTGEGIVK